MSVWANATSDVYTTATILRVIIKGENANLEDAISSHGTSNQRLNITLYEGSKLLGSKVIPASGQGGIDRIRFMINPDKTGEIEYRVQVNALPDEINIKNNKQIETNLREFNCIKISSKGKVSFYSYSLRPDPF